MTANDVALPATTTDDHGRTIPLPRMCPLWCDTDHVQYCEDSEGQLTAEDIATHVGSGFDDRVDDIHNSGTGRTTRRGVSYEAEIRQTHLDPLAGGGGWASEVLIYIRAGNQVVLPMTTGEVRVFAARLVALCDRVDLEYIVRDDRAYRPRVSPR